MQKLKVNGQLLSEERVKTDGRTDRRTDGGDCITSLASVVGKILYSASNIAVYIFYSKSVYTFMIMKRLALECETT